MNSRTAFPVAACIVLGFLALVTGYFFSGCSSTRLSECVSVCDGLARRNMAGAVTVKTESHECKCDLHLEGESYE